VDFKEHLKLAVEQSKWAQVKKDALNPENQWDNGMDKIKEHMEEWNRAINLDYYNRFALLFDADFRIRMKGTQELEHGWKRTVSVGMMEFLYNSIRGYE